MLGFVHSKKYRAFLIATAIMLLGMSVQSHAQNGTVHLHVVKAGFIVSAGSGTGTLSYQGKEYRLSVSTTGSGTIGVAGAELTGTAYNLQSAADIAGDYKTVGIGLTVGGGGQVARYHNPNGVILELVGVDLGLQIVLGSAKMTIALQ
jgi:hypothetical protein